MRNNDLSAELLVILDAIKDMIDSAQKMILDRKKASSEFSLLPRRDEILNIIKELHLVPFEVIKSRFLDVNERTLRYDLKQLADAGLIKKRGTTKGVYYEYEARLD